MLNCVICNSEIKTKNENYFCEECERKIRTVKKLKMVDNAAALLKKKLFSCLYDFSEKEMQDYCEEIKREILEEDELFSSIPEVEAAIQMKKIGLKYETQRKIAGRKVDFYIPELKIVMEIDGELYHTDENKSFLRDRQIMHELGEEWEIVHIKANRIPLYTWNLRDALPFIITQRNGEGMFRNSVMDSDYIMDFRNLEMYLRRCEFESSRLSKTNRKTGQTYTK